MSCMKVVSRGGAIQGCPVMLSYLAAKLLRRSTSETMIPTQHASVSIVAALSGLYSACVQGRVEFIESVAKDLKQYIIPAEALYLSPLHLPSTVVFFAPLSKRMVVHKRASSVEIADNGAVRLKWSKEVRSTHRAPRRSIRDTCGEPLGTRTPSPKVAWSEVQGAYTNHGLEHSMAESKVTAVDRTPKARRPEVRARLLLGSRFFHSGEPGPRAR